MPSHIERMATFVSWVSRGLLEEMLAWVRVAEERGPYTAGSLQVVPATAAGSTDVFARASRIVGAASADTALSARMTWNCMFWIMVRSMGDLEEWILYLMRSVEAIEIVAVNGLQEG
jgi:hypothetical protein